MFLSPLKAKWQSMRFFNRRKLDQPINTQPLPAVFANPMIGLYAPDNAAPQLPGKPIIPGGPKQGAGHEMRQEEPTFDRGDSSLIGPWREFFGNARTPDIKQV